MTVFTCMIIFTFSITNVKANQVSTSMSAFPNFMETIANIASGSTAWTLDATVSNVECYYKIVNCQGSTVVFLKFNNKNANNVKITWKEVYTTQLEKAVSGFFGQRELVLLPGFTADYDCSGVNEVLVLRTAQISPAYPVVVKQFNFSNITVTNL